MTDNKETSFEVEAKENEGKKFEIPKIVGYVAAGIAGAVAIAIGGIGLKELLSKTDYVGFDEENEPESDED